MRAAIPAVPVTVYAHPPAKEQDRPEELEAATKGLAIFLFELDKPL
jgi:hypothetical protein